jgi:hypothetical protein
VTVAAVCWFSEIWIPTSFATDCRSIMAPSVYGRPLGYMSVNVSCWPALMPGPHSSGPVPGLAQLLTPLGTIFQPCAASSARAAGTLNG